MLDELQLDSIYGNINLSDMNGGIDINNKYSGVRKVIAFGVCGKHDISELNSDYIARNFVLYESYAIANKFTIKRPDFCIFECDLDIASVIDLLDITHIGDIENYYISNKKSLGSLNANQIALQLAKERGLSGIRTIECSKTSFKLGTTSINYMGVYFKIIDPKVITNIRKSK